MNNNSKITDNPDRPGNYCYRYPHPAVTADCVIFGFDGNSLKVMLIERGIEPYKGYWALPGGFMRIDETIEEAAARELREETNLSNIYLQQFKVYSDTGRDPRERVITVSFIALVRQQDYSAVAGDDAVNAHWFDVKTLPPLAFDHKVIVREAREHLKEALRTRPIAFELLNKYFSLGELQRVYEVINDERYDRRNFHRSVIDSEIVKPADITLSFNEEIPDRTGRPATYFSRNNQDSISESAPSKSSTKGLFDFFRKK